jgi:hypothetical protein|tara:strand:+ start:1108 stop:1626 length:519 start_codon:yes stop_codon:yes gene_type:complete
MYFENFPTIAYDATGNKIFHTVSDILTRVVARAEVKTRDVLFTKYTVMENETPESVAFDYYGRSQYHWIILMLNQYYDRYYDWPMTQRNLQAYVLNKYTDPNSIHHYEISQKSGNTNTKIKVELADEPSATPITNFLYEAELNQNRKEIKLLDTSYLTSFISEFKLVVQNGN